ncbi:ABC transporter substrate-binding protein [Bacteroidota bacterium]
MRLNYVFVIIFLIFFSCDRTKDNHLNKDNKETSNSIVLKYAKGFSIEEKDNCKLITIKNPWQGAEGVEYKYALVNKNEPNPDIADVHIIKTPIKKVICLSTTHVAFLDVLNETNSIVALSGTKYVNNLRIREKIENKEILDVGYDNSLNYELIASLEPDLVITYGIGGQVASYNQKLNDLGIQTIIIAEYLENDPLGKLEWIKLLSAFFEKEALAFDYFKKVEEEYIELLDLTKEVESKPRVLLGLPWKGTWYVPGGKSFLAKMIKDAGGEYIWKENDSRESLPFDIESIFVNASDANVWINTGTVNNKIDILKTDERFINFEPYNKGQIFNNNLRMSQSGGNDYWETGLVDPHIVLKDMIKIFHSEILPEHKLVYYKIIE